MAYLVLARKWRPKRFAELVGQEHVVRALSNALDTGRVHHAFLFTGTRGVGKTTISRIFAKSLNCLEGQGAEPCGICSVCTDVDAGRFVDLIEIDAASHTGVDDVRDLIDNAQYLPSRGRIKVYLIDEVHMLSKSAFNALLKTLEEPPEHVKFLLATTDPQKLPVTVLSRCLQFNLRRLDTAQILGQMRKIVDAEGIAADDAALGQLARAADGSLRDGLSLLDQAIAYSGGQLSAAAVHAMLGTLDHAAVAGVLAALAEGDGPALLAAIEALAAFSPDYAQVLDDLATALHAIQRRQLVPSAADAEMASADTAALAERVAPELVQLWYQIATTGRRDLAIAPTPRIGFEMALLRMLAFRPLGQPGQREEPVKVPVMAPAVPTGPRKAPPSPFAQPTTPAAPPVERPVERTAEPIRVAVPPARVAEAAPLPPPRAPEPPPVPAAPIAPEPPAAAASARTLVDADAWLRALQGLALSGPVKELAAHAVFVRHAGRTLELALPAEFDHLRSELATKRLADALAPVLGDAPALRFVEMPQAAGGETLFDRQQREKSARQQQAETQFMNDPIVQRLVAQGATVVPGSIKPNEA